MNAPWEAWEDYAAGFYNPGVPTAMHVADSKALLCDPDRFFDAAAEMLHHWENSAVHNIQYLWTGRNAWIGQATCLYTHGAPPTATREAWGAMTEPQRDTANAVATKARHEWEGRQDGRETLFAV